MDTIGLLLTVLVTAAGVQDRDGAKPLLWNLRKAFPSVRLTWADSGYAGQLVTWAARLKPELRLHRQARRAAPVRRGSPPLGRRADLLLDPQVTPDSPGL